MIWYLLSITNACTHICDNSVLWYVYLFHVFHKKRMFVGFSLNEATNFSIVHTETCYKLVIHCNYFCCCQLHSQVVNWSTYVFMTSREVLQMLQLLLCLYFHCQIRCMCVAIELFGQQCSQSLDHSSVWLFVFQA